MKAFISIPLIIVVMLVLSIEFVWRILPNEPSSLSDNQADALQVSNVKPTAFEQQYISQWLSLHGTAAQAAIEDATDDENITSDIAVDETTQAGMMTDVWINQVQYRLLGVFVEDALQTSEQFAVLTPLNDSSVEPVTLRLNEVVHGYQLTQINLNNVELTSPNAAKIILTLFVQ